MSRGSRSSDSSPPQTLVWVLAIAAVIMFGFVRLATMATPLFASVGTTPAVISQATPDLAMALDSGNVDSIVARLDDPTTADRIASATGIGRDQVATSLGDIRGRVNDERANPGMAVSTARSGLERLVARRQPAAVTRGVPEPVPQPAATITGWVTFFVLAASLAAAIGGASAGWTPPRPAV